MFKGWSLENYIATCVGFFAFYYLLFVFFTGIWIPAKWSGDQDGGFLFLWIISIIIMGLIFLVKNGKLDT